MNDYYKIKNICKIKGGKRIPKGEVLQKEKNSHPYIRILDMYQGRIINISKDMLYAKESYIKQIKNYIVNENDVILAIVGNTLGMVSIIGNTLDTAQLTENCCKFVDIQEDKINRLFLYYALISPLNQNVIKKFRVGSSQPKLPLYNVGELLVPKFTLAIQSKISNLLSNIDSKIELNNKINNELESMAKTIYDYWFLQFEFPNEEGKPYKSSGGKMIWNEELKREIPEGWEVKKLKELFQFIKGKTAKSLVHNQINKDFKPYITIDVANGEIPKYCNDENMIICNGETIMVMDGAASGDIYVGIRGILGSTFAMLLPIDNSISSILIYHILQKYKDIYKKVNTGSTVPHANKDFIGNINVALPKDLSFFNSTFTSISKKIILNKKENRELTSLRDFLLPLLMNGQVGFKDKEDKAEG